MASSPATSIATKTAPAATRSPAIAVRGLRKGYGQWPVLWDLDLSLEQGRCMALFGANGAGKTTLLKVLSTQARADAGSLCVAGADVLSQPEAVRRSVGVVGHRHLLYEDMTASENLLFYGRMFGLPDVRRRVDEVIGTVGMASRAHHRVGTLSNGQQKRLAIARAILHDPQVLLLDEPEAGLDAEGQDILAGLVQDWRQRERTILLATHSLERGLEWADDVAVLAQGRIAFCRERRGLDVASFGADYRTVLESVP